MSAASTCQMVWHEDDRRPTAPPEESWSRGEGTRRLPHEDDGQCMNRRLSPGGPRSVPLAESSPPSMLPVSLAGDERETVGCTAGWYVGRMVRLHQMDFDHALWLMLHL
eukprot:scaffold86261_cov40-Tisochrysis_lutea.AAC.3